MAVLVVRLWRISRLFFVFGGKHGTPVDWNVICPWKHWKEDISCFRMHQTSSQTDRRLQLRVPTANAEATAIFEIGHLENPRKSSLSQASISTNSRISNLSGSRQTDHAKLPYRQSTGFQQWIRQAAILEIQHFENQAKYPYGLATIRIWFRVSSFSGSRVTPCTNLAIKKSTEFYHPATHWIPVSLCYPYSAFYYETALELNFNPWYLSNRLADWLPFRTLHGEYNLRSA